MEIKIKELYAAALSFLYCFCILSSYYIMRPIRDQLAVEVGSAMLPWFFSATLVVTLLLTPLFSWVTSRWPRHVVMPMTYVFFIVCQIFFVFLLYDKELLSTRTLGFLFFVWVSVFNLFVVSVFWSFMTDIWSDEQALRLFPLIALGGTFGAIAGPFFTRSFVELIGLSLLLAVSILPLLMAVICIVLLGNWARKYGSNRTKKEDEAPLGGGMFDGLKQIITNGFIANMSLMMLLSDAIGTIAYALVTDYSGTAFPNDPISQTRFAASMDLLSNVIQIILQLTLARWLLVRYGAGFVIAFSAAIAVCASLIMALSHDPYVPIVGIFPIVALVLIITRSLAHSMVQAARESLYTLVQRNLRYKGKNAVDTVVWRAGDVASLLGMNALRSLGVSIGGFGIIWATMAALSGMIGWRLANRVEKGEFQ